MPIYDYECKDCGIDISDEFVTHRDCDVSCPKCDKKMARQFPLQFTPKQYPKDGIFLKHVCPEGKRFYSETDMKRYAREHSLELGALL